MSYCRWSSDDYACDVYAYHHCGGWWQIYVAGRRHVPKEPLPEPVDFDADRDGWIRRQVEVSRIIGETTDFVDIGLAYDGESYQEPSPGAAADRLEMLKEAGYNVPQDAIDCLREEAKG